MKTSLITSLITAAVALAALALTSCKNLTLTAATPWGDVSSVDGQTTVIAKPIVILRDK